MARLNPNYYENSENALKGKLEVAMNSLREKIPVEVIARVTGLSINEIEQIAKKT